MSKTKVNIKEKSVSSLMEDLMQKRNDLFKAKLDHARRKLPNTSSITNMRKEIAYILTIIHMKGVSSIK